MNRYLASLGLCIGLLVTLACIQKETTHTVYLSPEGDIVWTTLERDIRSDAHQPVDRHREEQEFTDHVTAGLHPIGLAFQRLGGDSVRMRVLRRERPFAVMTEARFPRVDLAIDRLLDELNIRGSAVITREGTETTLAVSIGMPAPELDQPDDSPVPALIDCEAPYRFVLTAGRFVSAAGFTISNDGAIAVLDERIFEELDDPAGSVMLSLTWTLTSRAPD